MRAAFVYLEGAHIQGASTITQQVAKNSSSTRTGRSSAKSARSCSACASRSAYSKDKILELYLNEIYLGLGNYGVAAAALNYFDKSVNELTVAEVAYLAALPKEPSALNPFRNHDRARRPAQLRHRPDGRRRLHHRHRRQGARRTARRQSARADAESIAAGFFAKEVRRELSERYGEKKLYEGGFRSGPRSIRRCS